MQYKTPEFTLQVQSKENIFIPKIGSLGLTLGHGQSGSNFSDAKIELINSAVRVSVLKPGTKDRYYVILPYGSIKMVTGKENETNSQS